MLSDGDGLQPHSETEVVFPSEPQQRLLLGMLQTQQEQEQLASSSPANKGTALGSADSLSR